MTETDRSDTDVLSAQTMDRSTGLPNIANSGYHVPPEVLGIPSQGDPESSISASRPQSKFADVNARARKLASSAIRGTKSKAAIAAAIRTASQKMAHLDYSMFALLTYKSVEVIFATTSSGNIVGVCSRTHFVFQILCLASKSPVVSISGDSQSGMLVVAHEDGVVQTYRPFRNESREFGIAVRSEIPAATFGRYRWVNECAIIASEVFYHQGEEVRFSDRREARPGQLLDISTSNNNRVLIAHRKQLALFEVTPLLDPAEGTGLDESSGCATLLWTTVLPSNVVTAKISGDSHAIVAVLDVPNEHGKVGALTYIRDIDDGSQQKSPDQAKMRRGSSLGLIYKQGPFLEHSAPVSRISFRGLGRETSSDPDSSRLQGNDLLLTNCEQDSSNRIFNQNSWQQLMFWSTPHKSRADWIRGTSALSLGDLESQKKTKRKRLNSRRPSESSTTDSSAVGASAGLKNAGSLGIGVPTTSAGAWIAEVTFRGAFPALRLSRLSYMKRGNDDSQPAHFESVAAVLPAGSIVADSVLRSDDMGIVIQGVWPAWNPCLSQSIGLTSDEVLSGSAMEFLGLSSVSPHTSAFGESHLGCSLTPPTELRVLASHPEKGNLVIMEFPLWGDEEFGAMELGSPIRNVLALSHANTLPIDDIKKEHFPWVTTEYESNCISARVETDSNRISFLWQKLGTLSLYSPDWKEDEDIAAARSGSSRIAELLHDTSTIPVPLALPSLYLPLNITRNNHNKIVALKWLTDSNVGGPPLLLALAASGTLLVFEIAPPWCVTEPTMPNYDPFNSTLSDSANYHGMNQSASQDDEDRDLEYQREEYVVRVTPHPDFGLGLRLESPMDGTPAVAGSFKKHPLNGGMLPAEKTGMIFLGDELVSVNGVSLENMTFDDIISTVRHVGAKSGPGEALALKFRPAPLGRSKANSFAIQESFSAHPQSNEKHTNIHVSDEHTNERPEGLGSLLLRNSVEAQQEFGRLIGVILDAMPSSAAGNVLERFAVLPWENVWFPNGQTLSDDKALVLLAEGAQLFLRKIQLFRENGQVSVTIINLGTYKVLSKESVRLESICFIESFEEGLSFLLKDSDSVARILVLNFHNSTTGPDFHVFNVFSLEDQVVIRPASTCLFASFQNHTTKPSQTVTIWSARPDPSCREHISEVAVRDEHYGKDYVATRIEVESCHWNSSIRDIAFLETGYLDHFPSLVVFMESEAIIYQRSGGSTNWHPCIRLTYPSVPDSSLELFRVRKTELLKNIVPADEIPHLTRTLQSAFRSSDEKTTYVSDWQPEALLVYLFTDRRGAGVAWMAHVRKLLVWLSEQVVTSARDGLQASISPGSVPSFEACGGEHLLDENMKQPGDLGLREDVVSVMASLTRDRVSNNDSGDEKLEKLRSMLERWKGPTSDAKVAGRSQEFREAMLQEVRTMEDDLLPQALESLGPHEMRALWSIVDVSLNLPIFRQIDTEGQMALTIISLHASMKRNPFENPNMQAAKREGKKRLPSFYQKKSLLGVKNEKLLMPSHIAATGCLSALMSRYQGQLVSSIREPGTKLDWPRAREVRLAFWLRSESTLREISEEIGQNLYRESRDILKSSLFFILARKGRTLRNLAAADNTDSGRKFYKFLSDYDFSSPRGRSAAEKNAFSLLRKNRYECAAAFFLLPDPPILKSAVETIATKMRDLDLAFMVARLLGNHHAKNSTAGTLGFRSSSVGYSGAVIGGGGGYAGRGLDSSSDFQKDEVNFVDWDPKLPEVAKDLLNDRGLSESYDDPCFSAVQLFWLGRDDEASHWLSGFVGSHDGFLPRFAGDISMTRLDQMDSEGTEDAILRMNGFIDFVSGPLLLKMAKSSMRTRLASTLLVVSTLSRLGIELPCLRLILQNFDRATFEEVDMKLSSDNAGRGLQTSEAVAKTGQTKSSIFDSFDVPPPKKPQPAANKGQMQSSIFDSFDAPPPPKKPPAAANDGQMLSSIFDSFDAPPPKKPPAAANDSHMQSSIFDSFDGPPPKKPPAAANEGQVQSSIFDSFDAPPPMKTSGAASDGQMQSSIFDSCYAPPQQTALNASKLKSSSSSDSTANYGRPDRLESIRQKVFRKPSLVWIQWSRRILLDTAARRLVHDLISIDIGLDGDIFQTRVTLRNGVSLVPTNAARMLQTHCDGETLVGEIVGCVKNVSNLSRLGETVVVNRALQLLSSPNQFCRCCFVVLLRLAVNQLSLAEDAVRSTSMILMHHCGALSVSNNDLSQNRKSVSHVSTLSLRRHVANLSWQLELCLWLHRGGALPLSGSVLNEAICAVRLGLVIASWNQGFDCLEVLLEQPPDCLVDYDAGRQLWSSLKIITSSSLGERRQSGFGTPSGGWEFLVNCTRHDATDLLRLRETGCFILRPHPDDHGVFTLSFKTNLIPDNQSESDTTSTDPSSVTSSENKTQSKPVRRDDVVQHAIVRLSDSGFRCGSFGPFATLMKLLEAVSASLPFDLRFDQPPNQGLIKDEGSKPSPNCALYRKLGLLQAESISTIHSPHELFRVSESGSTSSMGSGMPDRREVKKDRRKRFLVFLELLLLSEVRKQLSGVAAARYDKNTHTVEEDSAEIDSFGIVSGVSSGGIGAEQEYAVSARVLRPLLIWCRMLEIGVVCELSPPLSQFSAFGHSKQLATNASESGIEVSTNTSGKSLVKDDSAVKKMIQPGSGVDFRTLRLGDGGDSALVVLFEKQEAVNWFVNAGHEKTEEGALQRLRGMESNRVIESVNLHLLHPKGLQQTVADAEERDEARGVKEAEIRYRLIDPWEVEPLYSREDETRSASLGRNRFLAFNLQRVHECYEEIFRTTGGASLLKLWAIAKGDLALTKTIAMVQPPWERAAGGDLQLLDGMVSEPDPFENSIREHLYKNALYRQLELPQRFIALVQVELLDLKNLTSPGGSLSLTVYSLLRLKRSRSSSPLTNKARTLDSVATSPIKLGKASGPNAPSSWGSVVRFRFALPEDTNIEGHSFDPDRESLFRGAPSVLQLSVYEKKFMSDALLGCADVKLDGLSSGGQLEEWLPLRTGDDGINWFARIRLTLRFELLCLAGDTNDDKEFAESACIQRIYHLSNNGGAKERMKNSSSTPDLLSYLESMVY